MAEYSFKGVLGFISKNYLIIAILLLGLFFRSYKARELFMYSHDQDLLGWFIKDVVVDHDLRLVGQETSVRGVYIGPLFYYLLIPFYLVFRMDPIGGVFFSIGLGLITVWSVYFVFSKIVNRAVGVTGSFIYAVSFYTVFTDREVVPTVTAALWSVWFLYCLYLFLKGEQKKAYIFLGILVGLIWHINLGLAIPLPLVLVAIFLSNKRINIRSIARGVATALIMLIPFYLFEARHSFQEIKAVFASFTQSSSEFAGGIDKFDRVMQLVVKNVSSLIWGSAIPVSQRNTFYLVMLLLVIASIKKLVDSKILVIIWTWIVLYIMFYSANSLILSEYYLNGLTVIWVIILAVTIGSLFNKNKPLLKKYGILILLGFLLVNIYRLYKIDINRSGYIDRRNLVSFIKSDALKHNYPCVSVSYITKPGFDFGYRYLYWIEGMHVNQSISGSPVYTIVFPHSMVDKLDLSFGALGLVLPDYEKYNMEEVKISCSGENSNLTDPLFGFTD